MTAPFEASKNVVEVITIAHTTMGPPESLGFSLHDDDVVIAPRSGIPLRVQPHAERPEPEQPEEIPAAVGDAEMPVAERGPEIEDYEVIVVDGVKLDTTSTLRTLRAACGNSWSSFKWW
jgi:hypothetical protein